MPYNFGESANGAASQLGGTPVLGALFGNPLATALLLTAVACIIALAVFGRPLAALRERRVARAALYFLAAATAIMFVHGHVMTSSTRQRAAQTSAREVVAGIQRAGVEGASEAAAPAFYGAAPLDGAPPLGTWGGADLGGSPMGAASRLNNVGALPDSDPFNIAAVAVPGPGVRAAAPPGL
jgi:hypothetical protein